MLQGLDPVLESIVGDLNRVTDFSKLIRLQKLHKKELKADDMQEFDKYGDPIKEHPAKKTISDILNGDDDEEEEEAADEDEVLDSEAPTVSTVKAALKVKKAHMKVKAKEAKAAAKLEAAEEEAEEKIEAAEEEA